MGFRTYTRAVLVALAIPAVATAASGAAGDVPKEPSKAEVQENAKEADASSGTATLAYFLALAANDRDLWLRTIAWDNAAAAAAALAAAPVSGSGPAPTPAQAPAQAASRPPGGAATVGGACGGATNGADAYIARESGGNPNARNPSGAWGCYQIMPGTWNGSCSDLGSYGSASTGAQAACASRLPHSAWAASGG